VNSTEQWQFKVGDEVISVDNRSLGRIVEFGPDRAAPRELTVEQGRLNQVNLKIPVDTIANYSDGTVYLSISEMEANGTRSE
jgi:hypothetical protein